MSDSFAPVAGSFTIERILARMKSAAVSLAVLSNRMSLKVARNRRSPRSQFRGGFLRPNPYNNKMIHHPDYEPFWAAAADLDFSIGFHEGASSGMPTVGV